MSIFLKKLTKPLLTNFLILFSFIVLIELIFGYWFDKDNFGPIMREHRLKNQPTLYNYEGKTYKYNYRRNYYGFRGDDIDPSDIEAIIMGGSTVDERYKPDEFTITGYLNKNLKKNKYNLTIVNAGIEAQSTVGMIYNFKHWFSKLKNFSPKIILYYIGMNDLTVAENVTIKTVGHGHVLNPEKIEVFFDNLKSRSFIFDKVRIFKFKFLPRKNFVKYDGNIDPDLKNNFKYINYETALKNYNIADLEKKHKKRITNYLTRVDILYENAKIINSHPIFVTNIGAKGHVEDAFIYNYSLISHCKIQKYDCIDMARKLEGKFNYWRGNAHTTRKGSEVIANLITEDLLKLVNKN